MNNIDLIEKNETTATARGGTELMLERLYDGRVDRALLEQFQIIPSRVRELNPNKVRILMLHDLPGDPESDHLKNNGWSKFNKLVFVSNWQAQAYINHYQIPPSHTEVIQNAIHPIPAHEKPKDVIRLAYWSTPHRGLELVIPVFEKLCETHDNIELHVFSSFQLYGWPERDEPYKQVFERGDAHPKIFMHGAISNEELRCRLHDMHILAYPSIWIETSCLVLMEAMSAGMLCVHPNLGALYETAANWTAMYQFHEDKQRHAEMFYRVLDFAINNFWNEPNQTRLQLQKVYTDLFYNWNTRAEQWKNFLLAHQNDSTEIIDQGAFFTYRVG